MKKIVNYFLQLNSHTSTDEQSIRYKIDFLNRVFLFAGVVAFGMGFFRWQDSVLAGIIDFVFSVLCFSLLFYLRQHKEKVEVVCSIALVLSYILFFAIFMLAPLNTTRSSLFFLLLASAIFLKGPKAGFYWIVFIIFSIVSGHIVSNSDLAYSHLDIFALILYLIALYFIFHSYETVNKDQKQALENLNLHLEDQIQSRTRELHHTVTELSKEMTERRLADHQLRIAACVFESQEGMMVTDENGLIVKVNLAFEKITGYCFDDVKDKNPRILSSGKQDKMFYENMWESVTHTGSWAGEIWNKHKNGNIYPEYLTITAVKNAAGIVTNYVGTFMDISLSKAASDEINNLAYYDTLTQLPNRRLLVDRLDRAFAASHRSGQHGALLFIDLDNFKALNDTLGHDVGDLLLQQVADRLSACVRECDTVARLGGDEFVVLLEDLDEQLMEAGTQSQHIAEKMIATLNEPYLISTYSYHGTCSIGLISFKGYESSVESLLKQADIAMYQAKEAGRNTFNFFDPVMQEKITQRVELENELRNAVEHQQFELYYQIQVGSHGKPLGAECLIRWQHPERGMISPFGFILIAEETGLIIPMGQWVLEAACAQLKKWGQEPITHDLVLAVNVSAKQFLHAGFVEQVRTTIQRYGINPTLLKIELTESALINNIQDIVIKMQELNKLGVRLSLDDFGTGYSSLQYLKMLPLNQLKIDQSFVRDIATDASDRAIVRTIINMASILEMNVIAEGVETEEQRQYLFDNGCTHYQGYLFGKPLPIDAFEASLRKI